MLETLRIRNYALIDEVEVDFRPGFNVLTGETGAGKSIVVGALNLVLGARASGDVLRAKTRRATIDAVFRIQAPSPRLAALLEAHDITLDEGELLLSRNIGDDGRSRGYVNGNLVPIGVLADIGDELVDLHGQHEHQSLLKADRQLDLLDSYGGAEAEAARVTERVRKMRALERERDALLEDDRDRTRQVEFLRFELAEIDKAGLEHGEEETLRARRNRIANAETIYNLAGRVCVALYDGEEGTVSQGLGVVVRELEELAEIDPRFRALAEQADEYRAGIEEIAGEVRALGGGLEYDPEELEQINGRLTLIRDLKRKYGADIAEILAYREKAAGEIDSYDRRDEHIAALHQACETAREQAEQAARVLSKKWRTTARKLDRQVSAALQDLGMKGARFETQLEPVPLGSNGLERVTFLLAANPGEPLKPLSLVASGGEISRVMLALKAVFATADHIPTLIFDEIDAGVGGAVALRVAEKLAALADSHQVVCITHIPQIAAVAGTHFHVSKSAVKKRTVTHVREVTNDARAEEVARLLDGSVSPLSLEHARALLTQSAQT